MAGLFDFLMQGQNQPGGGLLGGFGNALSNNQDTLIALGLGLAGGATPMEGFQGGMRGYLEGRKSDQSRVAGEQFMKELGGAMGAPASPAAPAMMPLGAMPQPVQQSGVPRGIRNNNPLNIEAGPFTQGMPGFAGSDGRFARFGTPEQGIGAANSLLDVYQNKHGLNTVAGIIGRWAPADENDTRSYIASVAGRMGVDPNQPLQPQQRTALIQAMGQFENGRPIPMGGPSLAMGPGGIPERPNAQGVYSADAVMLPQQAQADPAALPPNATPTQGFMIPGQPQQPVAPVPNDQLGAIRNLPIGTVLKWAMNPNLAGPQREVAKEIFKARLEDTKMTEAQKDYMRAKVDGYAGSFADWKNNPSFGDTGQRDEFDRPIQGWRNPNTGAVTPPKANVPGAAETKAPIELTTKLRNEVQSLPAYKNITQAEPVYNAMAEAAGRDNRASDVNLIYGFAKLMDPGSVVREGEMTIAQAISTLPQNLQSQIMSQLQGTGRLSADVRSAIMGEAHGRMTAYKNAFDQATTQYSGIVQRYRMNPADVLPQFGPFDKYQPKKAEGPSVFSNPYEAEMRRRGLLK